MTVTPVLQFGTSRFLQAHADLFLSESLTAGTALGPVTVVQSSGDPGRSVRLSALAAPGGYPVRIRGLSDGAAIDATQQVTSIRRTLSTATDWAEVVRVASDEARIILSNTSDSGYAPQPADSGAEFHQTMSYPAKLMHLLRARFARNPAPLQVMPMELIPDNGAVLRTRVLALAEPFGDALRAHLADDITWVNSLVDRIVSEPIEPAGAVAEPYALWAVEDQPGLILPCVHPCIRVYPSLLEPESLKLYLLNLSHTVLADGWLTHGGAPDDYVRHAMADTRRPALLALLEAEVIPGFRAAGMEPQARAYIATMLERFGNPFLNHRIAEIAQNHAFKIDRRIGGFLKFARAQGDGGAKPGLKAVLARQG